MAGKTIQIHGRAGSDFDCYLALPQAPGPVPAVVLASAVHGVDKDLRAIADDFASRGYLAAAPDLFWRTVPGPLTRDDPRIQVIVAGDTVDMLLDTGATSVLSPDAIAIVGAGPAVRASAFAAARRFAQWQGSDATT